MARVQFPLEKDFRLKTRNAYGRGGQAEGVAAGATPPADATGRSERRTIETDFLLGHHARFAGRRPANADCVRPAAAPERRKSGATAPAVRARTGQTTEEVQRSQAEGPAAGRAEKSKAAGVEIRGSRAAGRACVRVVSGQLEARAYLG